MRKINVKHILKTLKKIPSKLIFTIVIIIILLALIISLIVVQSSKQKSVVYVGNNIDENKYLGYKE